MNNLWLTDIQEGFTKAFIDKSARSKSALLPQFVSNNYKEGKKVLATVESELFSCDEFFISVAFITLGGIEPLLPVFKELERKSVKGKILTTDYLKFSEPKALKKLHDFSNVEVRMYKASENDGFHTKGYIFKDKEIYKIIVGSSNLTGSALATNHEWNAKIVSTTQGEYADEILNEFETLWNSKNSKRFEEFFANYEKEYQALKNDSKRFNDFRISLQESEYEIHKLEPNSMQRAFISRLDELRSEGQRRALLISATGTGKTYASAFAVEKIKPRRMLFLVHREQIAKKSLKSYQKLIGNTKTYGLLSGTHHDYDSDYLFATVWTMAKDETLAHFKPNDFEVIVVDEVHHAAAATYQKLVSYFTPRLLLGMTGSPDRADGYDIYSLFENNIAYEIRLQQALEENLLCPFHYFGITDETKDDILQIENNSARRLEYLISDERVESIIKNSEFYGYSGDRLKGLIFCSRKDEGEGLSEKLNERGYKTVFLSGENSQEFREECIEKLVTDTGNDVYDFIITVDIFNEGIDIPEVNQVIMLRPTESPIVFVQQLGRGLRKDKGKEFVVILDFIGNYTNNYMIPIALSGDRSYNKDNIRKYIREGNRVIPGLSTIHFDEISKERIYQSLNQSKVDSGFKKEKYFLLKAKLGRIPTMLDFYDYGDIDPTLFIDQKHRSYYEYVKEKDKAYKVSFTSSQQTMLSYITQFLLNGMRPHELIMLRMLVEKKKIVIQEVKQELKKFNPNIRWNEDDYNSAYRVLGNNFVNRAEDKKRYYGISFIDDIDRFVIKGSAELKQNLLDPYFRQEILTLVEYGLRVYKNKYINADSNNLVLYEKYTRGDICRLLNWDKDYQSTVYGYMVYKQTCPIFITYKKSSNISDLLKYNDQFINQELFSWMSRHNRTTETEEIRQIIKAKETGAKILLFIQKSNAEGKEHYYLGELQPEKYMNTEIESKTGKKESIVNVIFSLKNPVREDIYDYITHE